MADELRVINTEEERRKRRRQNKEKDSLPFGCGSRLTVAVIVFLILGAVVFAAFKWDDISPDGLARHASFADSQKEEAYTDITGSSVLEKNFQSLNSGLIYISDTSIVQLNHDCEKDFSEKHSFTNPLLKTSGIYTIVFNEGSDEYRIIYDKHKIHSGTQGTCITDCDINDSGDYCVLSDQTGYLSCLSVYNKSNEFVYSYSFSDYYAVSVSISKDGSKVAVGAMNSSDGRLVSKVYLLDVTKNEPIEVYTYEGQLIYEIKFIADDRFAVITDLLTSVVRSDGSKEIPYSYSSQILTAYDICYGKDIVLSLSKSDDGRSCSLITLNSDGYEIGSFATDLKIVALDAAEDRTAVISYGKLSIYGSFGDLFGEWDIGTDVKSVIFPQNKTVYVLGVSGITKMSLKY